MLEDYLQYWPGLSQRADFLLARLKNLPLKENLTSGGGRNKSMLFGALPNNMRGELGDVDINTWEYLVGIAEWITTKLIRRSNKVISNHIKEVAASLPPRVRLGLSCFTTGVIHKNYEGDWHTDKGSRQGTLVATLVVRESGSAGGFLEMRGETGLLMGAPMTHGSVVVFHGATILHRVSRTFGGDRYSVVFTARTGL